MDFATTLTDMFALPLPILEKAVRPVLVYAFLILAFRLVGKRDLIQFTTFDLVLLLLLSNTVQNSIIGTDDSVTGGVIGATVLLTLNSALNWVLYRFPTFRRVAVGEPETIVTDGVPERAALRRLQISHDELVSLVRQQNFSGIADVGHAEVRPTGTVVMQPRHPTADEQAMADIGARLERIEAAIERLLPPGPARPAGGPSADRPGPGTA